MPMPLSRSLLASVLVAATVHGNAAADMILVPTWRPDGEQLSATAIPATDPAIAPDASGGVYVAWRDLSDPAREEIRVQRLSRGGAALWHPAGVALRSAEGTAAGLRLLADGAGGIYVAWQDVRSSGSRARLQHLSANGTVVSGWPVGGLSVFAEAPEVWAPTIALGADATVLVAARSGHGWYYRKLVHRLTAEGTPSTGWPSAGVDITYWLGPLALTDPELVPSAEDFLVGFPAVDPGRNAGGVYTLVRGESGSQGTDLVVFGDESSSSAVDDGNLGAFVGSIHVGTYTVALSRLRRSLSGSELRWDWHRGFGEGIRLYGEGPRLVSDLRHGAYVVWPETHGTARRLMATRYDSAGAAYGGWTDPHQLLSDAAAVVGKFRLATDSTRRLIVTWEELLSGDSDIRIQCMESQGAIGGGMPVGGLSVCAVPGIQKSPAATIASDGAAVVVWQDDRFGAPAVFGQRLEASGAVGAISARTRETAEGLLIEWHFPDASPGKAEVWRRGPVAGTALVGEARSDGNGVLTHLTRDLVPGTRYDFWLRFVADGGVQTAGAVTVVGPPSGSWGMSLASPNPVRDRRIRVNLWVDPDPSATISLVDIAGRRQVSWPVENTRGGGSTFERELPGLPGGAYWLVLHQGGRSTRLPLRLLH